MRKKLGVLGAAVTLVLAGAAYAVVEVPGEDHPAGSIGAGFVELTEDQLRFPSAIDAFIPTGSASRRCLVTLAESNFAVPGTTVYCNARTVNGMDGIRVAISFPFDAPSDLIVAMTVYQQFAKQYGQPSLYTGG